MIVLIEPRTLSGSPAVAPTSKSYAQRVLIASLLCDEPVTIEMPTTCDDIEVTRRAIESIRAGERAVTVGDSATAARILQPILAACYPDVELVLSDQLARRPMEHYLTPVTARAGEFRVPSTVSSQYVSGLLYALPLLEGESTIIVEGELESRGYVEMTRAVLREFGVVSTEVAPGVYRVPGGQRYRSPGTVTCEADWSNALLWPDDMAQSELPDTVDVRHTPDLTPSLAVQAAIGERAVTFTGIERLRFKESDRVAGIMQMLTTFGVETHLSVGADGEEQLIVVGRGGVLNDGTVEGCGDHRIVMAAAVASCYAQDTVTITDAEAVTKSYPTFFDEFIRLGGCVEFEQST
ncbi:MAG: hypothetical protein FWG78_00300 [Coriobacteriia bacterium]|nr:hypothetical protein [Coriobacteriia bacterium]